jgi:dCMP deaminase
MVTRPDWDEYFMEIGKVVATRATCDRKHVGAVVVSQEHQILSTGYNGPPPGAEHCDDVGHQLVDGHCVRTVHAEANAIAQAAKNGVVLRWATIYTTASPCYDCAKLIANTGIKKVVFDEQYDSRYGMSGKVTEFLIACGVTVLGFQISPWRADEGPTDVEKAVAAERERNVKAVRKVIDVILAGQPELGRDWVESKFRDLFDVNDVAVNATIEKAVRTASTKAHDRAVEVCGILIDKTFPEMSSSQGKKYEFLRLLHIELQRDRLAQISKNLAP